MSASPGRFATTFIFITVMLDMVAFGIIGPVFPKLIAMFVGEGDVYWKEGMEKTRNQLASFGKQVYFEVIPRNGHFLPALSFDSSSRVFDQIGR